MARPMCSTEPLNVKVGGGGSYNSLQSALEDALPVVLHHRVRIDVTTNLGGEDVVVPPYLAAYTEPNSQGERIPVMIRGHGNSLNSITASGGVGALQIKDFRLTGTSPYDNENCAASCYHHDRMALTDCTIDTGGNAMIAYNGVVKATRTSVNAGGWGIKVKNFGRYYESSSGTSGNCNGPAYELDNGIIFFNHRNAGHMGGNPTVNASNPSDGGFVYDEGRSRLYGPNKFAVKGDNGAMYDIGVDSNGNLEARRL